MKKHSVPVYFTYRDRMTHRDRMTLLVTTENHDTYTETVLNSENLTYLSDSDSRFFKPLFVHCDNSKNVVHELVFETSDADLPVAEGEIGGRISYSIITGLHRLTNQSNDSWYVCFRWCDKLGFNTTHHTYWRMRHVERWLCTE